MAVGIIGLLLVVGIFIVPATQTGGFNFSFQVIGEDENHTPVTLPFAWWIQGVEVTYIRPVVTWSCSGDGLDWSTLELVGDFRIYRLDYQGRNPTDITPAQLYFLKSGEDAITGESYFSLLCDTVISGASISGVDANGNEYFNLEIAVSVTGFVEQTGSYGEDLTDTYEESLFFTLMWIDGSFVIGGGINR